MTRGRSQAREKNALGQLVQWLANNPDESQCETCQRWLALARTFRPPAARDEVGPRSFVDRSEDDDSDDDSGGDDRSGGNDDSEESGE